MSCPESTMRTTEVEQDSFHYLDAGGTGEKGRDQGG